MVVTGTLVGAPMSSSSEGDDIGEGEGVTMEIELDGGCTAENNSSVVMKESDVPTIWGSFTEQPGRGRNAGKQSTILGN